MSRARPSAEALQLERLLPLVSPRIGLIRSLSLRVRGDDEPRLPLIYDAVLANYDFRKGASLERGSCGKGLTDEAAMLGAIGEAVEHYCASHAATRRMRRSTIGALDGAAVAPTELVLFSNAQYATKDFPYSPWREDAEIPWMRALDPLTCESMWVPATLVYLNYSGEQPQDFLCPPTSSGLAAGATFADAIRSALLELIEREAFLVAWMNRLAAPEVDAEELPAGLRAIARAFDNACARIRFFVLPTDMPAWVVLALALGRDESMPAAVAGLGCEMEIEAALRKALFEVCQVYEPLRRNYDNGEANALNGYRDVHTLEQHGAFFLRRDHVHELDFLARDRTNFNPAAAVDHRRHDAEADRTALAEAIRSSGERALAIELTTPDLEGFPIHVARAIVTQMQPIHFGHSSARLGGRRLFELPVKLGLLSRPRTEDELNPCPHPLA